MALRWVDVMRFGALAAISLMAACGEPMPSDAEMIDRLEFDRAGFDEAIRIACVTPALTRIDLRGQEPPETEPGNLSPARTRALSAFMTKHDISSAYFECAPPVFASFVVASSGLGVSGQMKQLIFSLLGMSENQGGRLVPDTDSAVAAENEHWIQVHRDIGDGWFIRNSR